MNIQKLMQQAQQMQRKMKVVQENLKNIEIEGESGGGLVKVIMTASQEVKRISIDDSLIKKEEKEILEDLVTAAMNNAKAKADEKASEEMNDATGGMAGRFGF